MNNSAPITLDLAIANTDGLHLDSDLIAYDNLAAVPLPTKPHRLDGIFVALCLKGRVSYAVDTKESVVEEGEVIVISHGQVIDRCMASGDFNGIGLLISNKFFREIAANIQNLSGLFVFTRMHPVFPLAEDEIDTFKNYHRFIMKKLRDGGHHFRREVVRLLCTALLFDTGNAILRTQADIEVKQSRPEIIFSHFIRLVERHYKHERHVRWYAHVLGITPKYLSDSVRRSSHRTANDWIDSYVVKDICNQLKFTDRSIKAITDDLGFPNQSFLGRFFKDHMGMNPTAYRRG